MRRVVERHGLAEKLFELCESSLADIGYELVDVRIKGSPPNMVVRVFADREQGFTIDDCVTISRYLGDVFDAEDPIAHAYTMEVSSPGLNRPLRKAAHFSRFCGETVKVVARSLIEGRRRFKGALIEVTDTAIEIEVEGKRYQVPLALIDTANLVYRFE